jgi:hypothetical protein
MSDMMKMRNKPGALYVSDSTVAAYCKVSEFVEGGLHKTVFKFTNFPLSLTISSTGSTQGAGGKKIYTFPKGAIEIMSSQMKWDLLVADGTNVTTQCDLDIGLGTVVAGLSQAALTTTGCNIAGKYEIAFSTTVLSYANKNQTSNVVAPSGATAGAVLDGTSTAIDAYLNCAVAAGGMAVTGIGITFTGTVEVYWRNYGFSGE